MSDVSNEFFNAIYYHSQPLSWAFSLQIIAGVITYVITYIAKTKWLFQLHSMYLSWMQTLQRGSGYEKYILVLETNGLREETGPISSTESPVAITGMKD